MALAVVLLVLFSWTWSLADSQAPPLPPPSSNCSHRFLLSSRTVSEPCQESCFTTSPPLMLAECLSLGAILEMLGDSVAMESDCVVELQFSPGEYWLLPVQVQFSIALSAPEGGVMVQCRPSECQGGEGRGGEESNTSSVQRPIMAFEGGLLGNNMSVSIEGIYFSHCSRHFQFDEVRSVRITNCTFIDFSNSALDLFNVQEVEISECLFQDCTSLRGTAPFRANAGAVSVAYNRREGEAPPLFPTLQIRDSTFINNTAFLPVVPEDQINQAINLNAYPGRGGGLSLVPQGYHNNIRATVTGTVFRGNRADSFGGGIFLLVAGTETTHDILFEGCTLIGNRAGNTSFGGGIQVAFLLRNTPTDPTTVTFANSRFEGNSADFGGGMNILQVYSQGRGNQVVVERTWFVGNRATSSGAAIMFQTFAYVQNRSPQHFYNFTDCTFSDNAAPGAILGVGFASINFFGTIRFINNTGPALRIVGGLLVARGNLSFVGNRVESNEGGALFIQQFGQVKLLRGARLEFTNNTGRIGSAIVVDVQTASFVFSELVHNTQCFLIYEDTERPPNQWDDVSISFSGNVASIGPVVFISHLLHCSWYSVKVDNVTNQVVIKFETKKFVNWRAFSYDSTNVGTSHSDEDPMDERFYFQTQPVNITSAQLEKTLSPGELLPLNLNGMDQFGNPTYIIARVSDARSNVNSGAFSQAEGSIIEENVNISEQEQMVRFEPALLPIQPNIGSGEVKYGFTRDIDISSLDESEQRVPVIVDTPYNVISSPPLRLEVVVANCRPGYELRKTNNLLTCQCTEVDFYILNCEDDVIVLLDGQWAGTELEPLPHLDLHVCPTPYCRCRTRSGQQESCESLYYQNSTESSQQCHPTRNGTLCGSCINETAVGVLRPNCRICEGNHYYALGFLVAWDAFVVSLIVFAVTKLGMHFPHSLKGLLFYVQTVYYTTEYFPIAFWDARKYMLYVSSAVSLYFPYDFCLSASTPSLVVFGLKFIPSAVGLIVAVIATIGAFTIRIHNGRKRIWRALWSLVLLLYAPLLHNCLALLHCPNIPDVDGNEEKRRWYYDGEVVCFEDPVHSLLGAIAIIVLILLLLIIPALLTFTLLAYSGNLKSRATTDRVLAALMEGYRDSPEAIWWTTWELLRRLMLVSIVVALPGRSVASAYVVIATFAVHFFFKPYKKQFQNVIEILILLNYSILLLLRSTQTFLDNASSSGYTGTAVPDSVGRDLPDYDSVIWLFLPFFYGPLVFAVLYGLGALIYRIIKSLVNKMTRQQGVELANGGNEAIVNSMYVGHTTGSITTTEVEGPGY